MEKVMEDVAATAAHVSPTGVNPTDKRFGGELDFRMEVMKMSKTAKNKDWDVRTKE